MFDNSVKIVPQHQIYQTYLVMPGMICLDCMSTLASTSFFFFFHSLFQFIFISLTFTFLTLSATYLFTRYSEFLSIPFIILCPFFTSLLHTSFLLLYFLLYVLFPFPPYLFISLYPLFCFLKYYCSWFFFIFFYMPFNKIL